MQCYQEINSWTKHIFIFYYFLNKLRPTIEQWTNPKIYHFELMTLIATISLQQIKQN